MEEVKIENKRMCIWCGEWMGDSWWRYSHPKECPYFKVFCERNGVHVQPLKKKKVVPNEAK